jgi:hypothetical protein
MCCSFVKVRAVRALFFFLTNHPLPEHLYGDRLKRVDERTLSRRRGPIAQFSVAKK